MTAGVGVAFDAAGLPSPYLFGALLAGLGFALVRPGRLAIGDPAFTVGQALAGVALGAYVQASSLSALGREWAPVAGVSAATLGVSLLAGVVLARATELDRPTAALGMIAGGASGIVTMARDLGGDDRLVAFMQYLRVLVVVLLTPVLVALAFPGHHAGGVAAGTALIGTARDWYVTAGLALAGGLVMRVARVPAGVLIGPMVLAAAVSLSAPKGWYTVPGLVQDAAFAIIGLQVGLGFTLDTVRQTGRLLLPVLASVLGLMAACAGLAVALDQLTSVSLLNAYLATTPGGIYAVLAVAFGSGANSTFVIAVQGLRVVVMVLLAPVAVRLLLGRGEPAVATTP
ncbi:AbrB family transcriptional regulator [Baekduia soli]|uniref:AbrB family transcriptional regulator n=1 Tax=Baekduia soli TaxID=496014 RepID=UPI00165228EB|nr:AbrB family transcriptional regulator [Baekduia soli]